jgi:hypothetical protein
LGTSQKKTPQSRAHHRRKFCIAGHVTEENTTELGTSQKKTPQSRAHHRRKYRRAEHITEANTAELGTLQKKCRIDGHIIEENTAELGTSQKKTPQRWAHHRSKYYRAGNITEENTAELGTSQKKIWRKRFACWIPKATKTHSEYVMFIAFHCQP